jgi:lipopolysaccharide/colanic/teichoic acid biosynthesis glycosyltransferase
MKQRKRNSHDIIRTIFDYTVTVISLILLIPVIIILTISIKLAGKGPVIYSQKRIGRNGKPFDIYKFRSMHFGNEEGIVLISDRDDKRITSLGRFMRKYKFDEIPNFFNVLKGEMSIVGPRPEQQFYIDQIVQREPRYMQLRHVKPGITSWGQVKYGYASGVEEMIKRMEYDLFYLENRSFFFDLKIALHTMMIIFKGRGILKK